MSLLTTAWTALLPLAAAAPDPQQPGGNPLLQSLMFILVMFAILYFLMIRPQRKRQREHVDMISALKKGDKIITRGGIYGTITLVRDRDVKVKVDSNCEVTLSKSAVSVVLGADSDEGSKEKENGKG
jgi:preprotein translocase subunit YajC